MKEYEAYIASFQKEQDAFFDVMESYAVDHHVPIMEPAGINTFLSLLRIQQPASLLEIGSAIGYSAIRMTAALPELTVYTVEKDEARYKMAVDYIKRSTSHDRIIIHHGDALELDEKSVTEGKYVDALFIDAAKGQYKRFFEKYAHLVCKNGVIYCDNMFMHGLVLLDDKEVPRRSRTMIRNLKEFTNWIFNHADYEASLLPIGDGILIAVKK